VSHRYGWVPDVPDQRDLHYTSVRPRAVLPQKVSLRPNWPEVLDQGALGSCVWNAAASHFLFDLARQSDEIFLPSRLFGYYNTRLMEGTTEQDEGCMIRDAVKVLVKTGVCDEREWPYSIKRFATRPPKPLYGHARKHRLESYSRVPRALRAMQQCLADGFPFIVGITIYESFESAMVAKTGTVPIPRKDERALGGHAVVVVGYNSTEMRFSLVNSWSTAWGDRGFFTLPYDYLLNPGLSDDFWTLRMVEG
jgi:C1A family cysteine protease